MIKAAEEDNRASSQGRPAISKLRMIPSVLSMLEKYVKPFNYQNALFVNRFFCLYRKHLIDSVLENGLLDAIRMWLEPFPSTGVLPSSSLRISLLQALKMLPIETQHLRESGGLGRIVMFYARPPKPVRAILAKDPPILQKHAQFLTDRWLKPFTRQMQRERRLEELRAKSKETLETKVKDMLKDEDQEMSHADP